MNIISIKTGADEDVRRIELSDGSIFSFKIGYLPPVNANENLYTPGMAEGLEISTAEEEGFRFASACMRAEKAALQLIARAEQTVFGLSRKLEKRGHDMPCIRAVISQLCDTGLLDDRRYAGLWVESRISQRASSPRRLLAALCARVDRHDAEAALKEVLGEEAEQQLLERYVQNLQRGQTGNSNEVAPADLRSLRYTLKNEGFSTQAIQQFFNE
jgi:regulatory protein